MSVRDLNLGQLSLADSACNLKLSVTASGAFSLPPNLSSLNDTELQEALLSGRIWTARGRACRISIRVSFNGRPLDADNRLQVLKSIGYQCRDAHLWTQLSLSSSLDIPQCDSVSSSNLSIFLNYASFPKSIKPLFQGWPLDSVDASPPDVVSVATFQKLVVNLNFQAQPRYSQPPARRWKRSVQLQGPLLSPFPASPPQPAENHYPLAGEVVLHDLLNGLTPIHSDQQPIRGANGRFSPHIVASLEGWFLKHANHPWPTNEQKMDLMHRTGLKRDQINTWMGYQRKKQRRGVISTQTNENDDMLLAQDVNNKFDEDKDLLLLFPGDQIFETEELFESLKSQLPDIDQDAMLLRSEYNLADNEMLLLHTSAPNPSFEFESPIPSQLLSHSVDKINHLRAMPLDSPVVSTLDTKFAGRLTSAAFMMLISGQRRSRGIKFETSHSLTNLSSVVPSMFCPGFRELMSHHAKIVPTICNAASSSWLRNAQGFGLKSKLQALSTPETGTLAASIFQPRPSTQGAAIDSVIQASLWRMMQQALNGTSAVKNLLWDKPTNEDADVDEQNDDPDLLLEHLGKKERTPAFESLLDAQIMDEDEEEMLDILLREKENESDDGLLGYLGEIERQAIERETEEMLFGSQDTFDDLGHDEYVLDDVSEISDRMLF